MAKKQLGYKSDVLNADPITLTGDGVTLALSPREFSSGKVGFGLNQPITIKVGGKVYKFQASVNIVAHHSDKWVPSRPTAAKAPMAKKSERPEA